MVSLLNLISTAQIVFLAIFGTIFLLFVVYLCFVPMKSYFTAVFSGCYIPTGKLIGLKSRKFDVKQITSLYIMAKKAKLDISLRDIESVIQSCGNMEEIIKALTLLKNADKQIPKTLAIAVELATNSVFNLAQKSIVAANEKITDIKGITIDGFELCAEVSFSCKVNLEKFASSMTIEDLKAKLFSLIMENISSSQDHGHILKAPNETLLKGIDLSSICQNTMFEIANLVVVSVSITCDFNAENEYKSVEKEKLYASIEAERKKNAEEIRLLQTKTQIEQMKSSVLQAEAEVPHALSQAIKEGRFSVMDYYKLMNLQADTALRRAIIGGNNGNDDDDYDDGE